MTMCVFLSSCTSLQPNPLSDKKNNQQRVKQTQHESVVRRENNMKTAQSGQADEFTETDADMQSK